MYLNKDLFFFCFLVLFLKSLFPDFFPPDYNFCFFFSIFAVFFKRGNCLYKEEDVDVLE